MIEPAGIPCCVNEVGPRVFAIMGAMNGAPRVAWSITTRRGAHPINTLALRLPKPNVLLRRPSDGLPSCFPAIAGLRIGSILPQFPVSHRP